MKLHQRLRSVLSRFRHRILGEPSAVDAGETHPFMGFDIPVDLMRLTGGGPESFDAISAAHIANLQREVGLQPQHCVLELGCGIGRDAIPMTRILTGGRYLGIDIIKNSIDWCTANITRRYPNFQFAHFDVKDQLHNAGGTTATREIRIPLPDASVDRVIAQSVFTHLYAHDIVHYLREIRRVLKPSGLTYLTFFVYDDEVLKAARLTNPDLPNLRFEHQLEPDCRIGDPDHPLGSIAYTKERLEEMVRQAGLDFAKPLLPGAWSGYYKNAADGQDVAVLRVRAEAPRL
jgi:SAM-dependent methyltransferase